jgi:hypothetical protein
VQINEETITNLLMLRLQEITSPHLRVKSFTKKQESRTGADWEWWLGTPGNWVGFRLQAKVINFRSESFEHLYYTPNGVPQYERLLSDALNTSPRAGTAIFHARTFWTGTLDGRHLQCLRLLSKGDSDCHSANGKCLQQKSPSHVHSLLMILVVASADGKLVTWQSPLVPGGCFFGVLDDEHPNLAFSRFQLQTELLPHGPGEIR